MEPAKIDWETIHSVFVKDDLFEHFNAPQWVDFSAPDQESIDDDAWFCKPDCNHPNTIEDFLQRTTSPSKVIQRSPMSEILPLGDRNKRDANLKRRGLAQPLFSSPKYSKYDRFVEDGENQNPNFPTTPSHQQTSLKAAASKSSTEKKKHTNSFSHKDERPPHLKSTLSARNLFGGRDILSHITEFCNDLKKMAMRAKESEIVEKSPAVVKKSNVCDGEGMGELDDVREKESKPLLELNKERCEMEKKSNVKEKLRRKKRADEAENIPISLDVKNVKRKEGDALSQIRTCPPSPQCFSAGRGPSKATPLKANRSRPPERGILQELDRCCNTELPKEEAANKNNRGRTPSAEREEPRTLDVFWFLKPCTLSS